MLRVCACLLGVSLVYGAYAERLIGIEALVICTTCLVYAGFMRLLFSN